MFNNKSVQKSDSIIKKSIFSLSIDKAKKESSQCFSRTCTLQPLSPGSLAKKSKHTKILKETETQTSKTIIQLAKIEKREMSPDSLCGDSHHVTHSLSKCTLENQCQTQESYNLNTRLTQIFLDRNRNKSPLIQCFGKSKSFVDHHHQQPIYNNANLKSIVLSDNTFAARRQNSTLMQPTTSFQIKSQMEDVQLVKKLIPQVRRGRSTSPKPTSDKHRLKKPSRKIPYIDQCKSEVSSSTTLINIIREPNRVQEFFNNNLLKTDGNNLELKLSDLSLNKSYSSVMDNTICLAINKLRDPDWRISLRGLAEVVEITRLIDANLTDNYMSCIYQKVIDLLRSPRSHVCRIACQAVGHLFEYVKDTRKPEFDEIVDLLLHKTADANRFIRHDANLALDCMVTHINIFNSVKALCCKGPTHKNPLVRCATVRLLVCAVIMTGAASILNPNNNEFTRKRVILYMIRFLEDKNIDTRKMAERLYKVLCKEDRFEVYLKKYLTTEQVTKIKKTLKLIHKK